MSDFNPNSSHACVACDCVIKRLARLEAVAQCARNLKPRQPSEVRLGQCLVGGWDELIIALAELKDETK